MGTRILLAVLSAAIASHAADSVAEQVTRKIDAIENEKIKRGSVVVFTVAELNAWARTKIPTIVPEGVREPRLELGNNTATGYALVDFLKVRSGAGIETSWLVAKLIQGEKPVKVNASIQSANGRARVHLLRVEIGGLAVSGATLDFLIKTFFLPLYPNAKIDEPFVLQYRIDRIDATPAAAHVYIKR